MRKVLLAMCIICSLTVVGQKTQNYMGLYDNLQLHLKVSNVNSESKIKVFPIGKQPLKVYYNFSKVFGDMDAMLDSTLKGAASFINPANGKTIIIYHFAEVLETKHNAAVAGFYTSGNSKLFFMVREDVLDK
jgi:hypothetical protein